MKRKDITLRRTERVALMFTPAELARVDAYWKYKGAKHRVDIFRDAVMRIVERWEKRELSKVQSSDQ
jgi:inactivated superfamily I helicase